MCTTRQLTPGLGRLAIVKGYASPTEIRGALMQHEANPGSQLGAILVERRVVTPSELRDLLALQRRIAEDSMARRNELEVVFEDF